MDRVRRLAQFWNWLPAFRAVAETQHLPTAASQLGVSAPALSRTVKLLESELGEPLFLRSKGRIELNHAGRELLAYVRRSMRLLDDGVQAVADSTFRGPVRIAASYSVQLSHVLPALEGLLATHPELEPDIAPIDVASGYDALRNGELDLMFVEDANGDDELEIHRLDRIDYAVFAAPEHPLIVEPVDGLDLATCGEHAWVVPDKIATYDGWPPDVPRKVGMRTSSLGIAIEACHRLGLLAHMPAVVGKAQPRLRQVILSGVSQELYVTRRPQLDDEPDRVSVTIDAVRALIRAREAG